MKNATAKKKTKAKIKKIANQSSRFTRMMDVKSDIVFKKIFGQHKNLIKSFLNGILPLPEERLIKSVEYLTPEQSPRIPSMKNTIVDVKCKDKTGRIFIVEMQLAWSANFMKRFLYGASKAFVQQMKVREAYGSLCPVYGLAIIGEPFESETTEWFHHYKLTHVKDKNKSLEGLELIFIELNKFKPETIEHRKMGILWLRFLKESGDLSTIPQEFQDDPDLAQAVELAQESAYTPEELESYDRYLDAIRVEKTIREDSYVEGEQIGLEKGEQIGLEKGKAEGKAEIAKQLILDGMPPEKVSKITGLSLEVIQEL